MRAPVLALAMLLAACGQSADEGETAEDFAGRVGTGTATAGNAPRPVETFAAEAPPPPQANVFELEQLGDVRGVNLGPRAGGCTFSADGTEMLTAAAPADRALPGKATVRVAGKLVVLDAPPGGFDQVRMGTVFNGEGFSVLVSPTGGGNADLTITDAAGQQQTFKGRWVCR